MEQELKIFYVETSEIRSYENNPRQNDEAAEKLAAIIERYGFRQPLLLTNDRDKQIVCGETRLKAAKILGMERLPVMYADDMNEDEIRAFRIADNKTSEYAQWDEEKLMAEFEALAENAAFDISMTGFDEKEYLKFMEKEGEALSAAADDFHYKEQYGVIVMCKDEAEQEQVYTALQEQGYDCKVVAT